MSRKKKKKSKINTVVMPELQLSDKAKKSISIVFLVVFAVISFLGLFNLSGHFGAFVSKYLNLIFGFGKWLIPFIFIYWSLVLGDKIGHNFKTSNYLGFFFLFISYQTLFTFFIKPELWMSSVQDGYGGGYVGLYLSKAIYYVFDFWGGVVFLIALLLVSLLLAFNTSLTKIIGSESFFAKILSPLVVFFKTLFSKNKSVEPKEDASSEINDFINESKKEILSSWEKKGLDYVEADEATEVSETINPATAKKDLKKTQEKISWPKRKINIDLPIELLNNKFSKPVGGNVEHNAERVRKTLEKFGIDVEMGETKVGPTVTQYTFRPAEGVKLSRITTLNNDLSLALAAHPIRIEAPIPGKSLVGIEVPNKAKAVVGLRGVLEDESFKKRKSNLMISLGKDVAGNSWLYDLTKMPHLLVAGATNSGKSVCLNAIIVSLLYQNNPDDLRFIMVDPKRVELSTYNGIPHLLTPVITDANKTINALRWCLNEMDRRYDVLNEADKRNIKSYNAVAKEKLPYIVFIIDELADFMMTSGKEMEAAIIRLAQMSRAIGIHLILATQRPSVDVITGLIKANIPTRIAFSVASLVDSKTILDASGAEKLLGQGDMLFSTAEFSKPKRIQGAFLSDDDINDVVNYIKEKSGEADYLEGVTSRQKVSGNAGVGMDGVHGDEDELLEEAKELIIKAGKASTSMLQRRLSIGYGRAAKILDTLEDEEIIGPSNGPKAREVFMTLEQYKASSEESSLAGIPIHDRDSFKAPDNYFSQESEAQQEEVDDALVFNANKGSSYNETEEEEELVEDEKDKKEDENENEDEIPELDDETDNGDSDNKETEAEEENEDEEREEEKENTRSRKILPFEDDDEMFFSR